LRAALRSCAWVIVLLAVVGALVGAALGSALPRTWSATSSVLVTPLEGNAYNPTTQGTADTNLETEAQIAGSDVITSKVVDSRHLKMTARALAQNTDVAVEPNTQVLQVTYHSAQQTGVAKITQAIAKTFLDYRSQRRDESVQSRQDTIDQRIASIDAQVSSLQQRTPPPTLQLRALGGQLLNLRVQAAGLASAATSPGEIITDATPQRSGLALPVWALVLAGAVLGLLIGVVYAVSRERRSDVIRSEDELADLDVELLGHQQLARARGGRGLVDTGEASVDVAAVLRHGASAPATVAVSSDVRGAPSNPLSRDLATELRRSGASVLVVDAASESAQQQPGLSDLLLDEELKLADLVSHQDGIATLAVGRKPSDIAPLCATRRFTDVLEEATARFDWTIVNTPPESTPTGRSLLRQCRHWVSVVTLNHASRRDIDNALHWSRVHGVDLLGFVLSASTRRRASNGAVRAGS
jgi:capsular polysaccharide biosynthesis protein